MNLFLVRRVLGLLATVLAASLVVFIVLEVLPSDPAALMLGTDARPDTLAALRRELGLDQPSWWRYVTWIGNLLRGDLGISYTYRVPVSELIGARVEVTLPLALLAIGLSTTIAIPIGVFSASRRGAASDTAMMAGAQLGIAMPNFWLGILFILVFAVWLGWFPAGGFAGWDKGVGAALHSLVLPAFALALPQAAILSRVTRASVLETLGQDYVRTARAKGLTATVALWRHAVPNALIPVVTILGLQFSFLLAGTVIIENVFTLPGLGRLMFQSIAQRDLIVVQDLVVLMATSVIVINFVVDMIYRLLDPRIGAGAQ